MIPTSYSLFTILLSSYEKTIMKLTDDVHWYIFNINAADSRTQQESRLSTIRASSQVCRRWRRILLGSSSIWGKLVLIKLPRRQEWLTEILKRSGTSRLWIACVPPSQAQSSADEEEQHLSTLMNIFEANWDRVERLFIDVSYPAYSRIWEFLKRPAPILRALTVCKTDSPLFQLDSLLFCNHAPLLHTFKAVNLIFPKATTFIPWFVNISVLQLNITRSSAKAVLHVLSTTTLLESLNIINDHSYQTHYRYRRNRQSRYYYDEEDDEYVYGDTHPMVELPHLKQIKGKIPLYIFIALWRRISLSPQGCFIELVVNIRTRHCSKDLMEKFPRALSNLICHYPRDIPFDSQFLSEQNPWEIKFRVNGYSKSGFTFTKDSFYFRFSHVHNSLPTWLASQLILTFKPHVQDLAILKLRIRPKDPEHQYPGLKQMLHSMKAVSTLKSNIESFEFLCDRDNDAIIASQSFPSASTPLFPALETLEMLPLGSDLDQTNREFSHLLRFIQPRVEHSGRPTITIRVHENLETISPYCEALGHFPSLRIQYADKQTGH